MSTKNQTAAEKIFTSLNATYSLTDVAAVVGMNIESLRSRVLTCGYTAKGGFTAEQITRLDELGCFSKLATFKLKSAEHRARLAAAVASF